MTEKKTTTAQHGRIPGVSYGIAAWTIQQLRQWIVDNISQLLPRSVQVDDVQSQTVEVSTKLALSAAALRDLKNQLGLP